MVYLLFLICVYPCNLWISLTFCNMKLNPYRGSYYLVWFTMGLPPMGIKILPLRGNSASSCILLSAICHSRSPMDLFSLLPYQPTSLYNFSICVHLCNRWTVFYVLGFYKLYYRIYSPNILLT